jgi:hypothetical protein
VATRTPLDNHGVGGDGERGRGRSAISGSRSYARTPKTLVTAERLVHEPQTGIRRTEAALPWPVMAASSAMAMLAALREEAEAAEAALRPTIEEERAVLEATRQHVVEHGVNAKAGGEHGWVGSMRRKFERYLEKHGADVGYDTAVGLEPDSKGFGVVREFMDYCHSGLGREQLFSGVGRNRSLVGCASRGAVPVNVGAWSYPS